MRWKTHGERTLYRSNWVGLGLVDVELPDGTRFDHHVVRYPNQAAGVVASDPDRGVLLLWRHRFTTDSWGWEIPAGGIEDDETPAQAAVRETVEETGWEPGPLRHLGKFHPSNGSSDQVFHIFLADGAEHVGEPVDVHEAERIEWVPFEQLPKLIANGEVSDGLSLTALLWFLTLH